jgi:hypothetical protein
MFNFSNINYKKLCINKKGTKWQSYCQEDCIHCHLQGNPYNIVPTAIHKTIPMFFIYFATNKSPNDYNLKCKLELSYFYKNVVM